MGRTHLPPPAAAAEAGATAADGARRVPHPPAHWRPTAVRRGSAPSAAAAEAAGRPAPADDASSEPSAPPPAAEPAAPGAAMDRRWRPLSDKTLRLLAARDAARHAAQQAAKQPPAVGAQAAPGAGTAGAGRGGSDIDALLAAGAEGLLSEGDAVAHTDDAGVRRAATVASVDRSAMRPPRYLLQFTDGSRRTVPAAQVTALSAEGGEPDAIGFGTAEPADQAMMGVGGTASVVAVAGAVGGFSVAVVAAPLLAMIAAVGVGINLVSDDDVTQPSATA